MALDPMQKPPWLVSQLADRAADQMNKCLAIAANLHAQGKSHHDDPTWQAAAIESRRLIDASGVDAHDIGAEAARRRS
jgi:hypothetical protein